MERVMLIFGTRPEAIKMAPVIRELWNFDRIKVSVVVTAQHRQMLDQVLGLFDIVPDYDLDLMKPDQDLFDVSAMGLLGLREILQKERPGLVLVQGDTTSTFIGSLAAYYEKIPVGHVEAGLRTHDRYAPFPEEINRRLTGVIADLHFAPTSRARDNLLKENVPKESIHVTGNTSIDALLWTIANSRCDLHDIVPSKAFHQRPGKFILVTTHRRESFGAPMQNVMEALRIIADRFPSMPIVFPVHHNPNVRRAVQALLDKKNIVLIDPVGYKEFAHLMSEAHVILTDSGGIQEEAPSLGKPILVLRDTTERPEGIEAGNALLVGTNTRKIVDEVERLLSDGAHYGDMAAKKNPYGDGKASARIVEIAAGFLSSQEAS